MVEDEAVEGVFLFLGVAIILIGFYVLYVFIRFVMHLGSPTRSVKVRPLPPPQPARPHPSDDFEHVGPVLLDLHGQSRWTDVDPSIRSAVRRRALQSLMESR